MIDDAVLREGIALTHLDMFYYTYVATIKFRPLRTIMHALTPPTNFARQDKRFYVDLIIIKFLTQLLD